MAKGLDKIREREADIAFHGKDLARRAGRVCELCGAGDGLRPYDTAPESEPSLDTLFLCCQRCRALAQGDTGDPRTLRFLETAVWSELEQVQRVARQILRSVDADWARDTLSMLSD